MFDKIKNIFAKGINEVEKIAKKEKEIKEKDLEPILWEMQLYLIKNNLALEVAEEITKKIKEKLVGKKIKQGNIKNEIKKALEEYLNSIFSSLTIEDIIKRSKKEKPFVIVFFGFNGSGKTTSIAKLAYLLKKHGKKVVLAAADTFRAAAIEQLEEHGNKLGIKVIKHKYGGDSAAVIYDAIQHAKSKAIDFVLADTAGRVHTNKNLIEELKKIVRVNKPHLKVFVSESIAGNDLIEQARVFNEVGIDAVILTKFDVDDKKGSLISIAGTLKKPILFLGIGQEYEDIKLFNKEEIIKEITEGI